MGLFDFLKSGKADGEERAVLRHAEKVMDKRAMSPDRFASIEYLCRLATAEAWRALLPRFNFVVDPSITDHEEKAYIFDAITANPENAVVPVKEFLRITPSLTWPAKMLKSMVSREDLVTELVNLLATHDTGYEKNAERKGQLISALEEETDPRVPAAVLPFLQDFTEDIRFAAVRTLAAQADELAREPLVKLLIEDASARIRCTVVEGLAARGWAIDAAQRDQVARLLQMLPNGPWVITKDLKITRATRL